MSKGNQQPEENNEGAASTSTDFVGTDDVQLSSLRPFRVCDNKCLHEIGKLGYNPRFYLACELDAKPNLGIIALMHCLLNTADYITVWRRARGGLGPALGLMFHLAATKNTTLGDLRKYVLDLQYKNDRFQTLLNMIDQEIEKDKSLAEMRLDELSFTLLERLASEVTSRPLPKKRSMLQDIWKTIAGEADLDMTTISLLAQDGCLDGDESLTMMFLEFMGQKYPSSKVAWLAKGLQRINRIDLVRSEDIFKPCHVQECIVGPDNEESREVPDGRRRAQFDIELQRELEENNGALN